MILGRLERAFERAVAGSIASIFRLGVQPAEIGRQLERAMLERRLTSVGTTLAPNRYQVRLHPEDAATFSDWEGALCREMETWLAEVAFARGLGTIGPIRVQIMEDASVPRRAVRAEARFADMSAGLEKVQQRRLRLLPAHASIPTVILASAPVSVGRANDNDVILLDPEISRHHARLEPTGADWSVVDLQSTNGTWVNGARVHRACIEPGDELAFGRVRFTVESG
jgi:Protein of unknown function (DUF3662)/FHA domain